MALLSINNVSVAIGQSTVLDAVSTHVDAGEVLGVAGESGSGKTMLALAIAGLLPDRAVLSGKITLDGTDLSAASEADYCALRGSEIGLVFQEPMTALNPVMTIGQQVAETIRLHRQVSRSSALSSAAEILDMVGLPASQFGMDCYPHSLSGGQRQRVAIAIAIALKPRVLIADEATTALDVTTQADILALFSQLVRVNGIALILVTHDLAVVSQVADRVAVLKTGQVVEQGSVVDVFSKSDHPYVRKLMQNAGYQPPSRAAIGTAGIPILETRDVVREFSRGGSLFKNRTNLRAVDGVSFKIYPNERVGLVGESGCGKSTLLRTILGLEMAQQGEVRLSGKLFPTNRKKEMQQLRRQIQVVFQDPYGTFNPRWRVIDIVSEGFHLLETPPGRAEANRRVHEILEQVGLDTSAADKFPHEFSGGQRQRIAIARALVTGPSIIALDEAVSALDVSIRAKILDLLAELSDRLGMAYLFVTHDLSVVKSVTDRLLVMKSGKIVEHGKTSEIFANPQHQYTGELLAAVPRLDHALTCEDKSQ